MATATSTAVVVAIAMIALFAMLTTTTTTTMMMASAFVIVSTTGLSWSSSSSIGRTAAVRMSMIASAKNGPNDDDDASVTMDDDSGNDDNDNDRGRKRDVLRGGGATREKSSRRVLLNTDNLLRGMPSLESILGGGSRGGVGGDDGSSSPSSPPSSSSSAPPPPSRGGVGGGGGRGDGGSNPLDALLTPEDVSYIDALYERRREESGDAIDDDLLSGKNDDYDYYDENDKRRRTGRGDDVETKSITRDEARRIVEYVIEEERAEEMNDARYRRKRELIERWDKDVNDAEGTIDVEFEVKNDGVVNEILDEDDAKRRREYESSRLRKELEGYYEEKMEERGAYDDGDDVDIVGYDVGDDFDATYERSLDELRASRSGKLGSRTLGVLSNSIALEEGREYARRTRRAKEFLADVEKELINELGGGGELSDDDISTFFRRPSTLEEERTYRSIVRRIVDRREGGGDGERERGGGRAAVLVPSAAAAAVDDDDDRDGDGGDDEYGNNFSPSDDDDDRYELSAGETLEAYKLLNLWREVRSIQDAMEVEVGMKDEDDDDGRGVGRRPPPTNKIEPFFLYEENTEEKRRKEKDSLSKALRKVLVGGIGGGEGGGGDGNDAKDDRDNAETSSDELLLKELFALDEGAGGGITKDRAIRLLDKMLRKTSNDAIRYSLMELKGVILEDDAAVDGDGGNGATTTVGGARGAHRFRKEKSGGTEGKPIDLSGVFRTSDSYAEKGEGAAERAPATPPPPPSSSGGDSRTMPPWVRASSSEGVVASRRPPDAASFDATPPPPNTPFFQSSISDYDCEDDSEVEEDEDDEGDKEEGVPRVKSSTTGGMFGTYEEQRLRKLAKRVGAQTEAEMDELRRNMEALKAAEEMANAELSNDDNFDFEAESAKLGIDVSSLNLDDDNDNQIISIIGKRPVISSSSTAATSVVLDPGESNDGIFVDAEGRLRKMESGGGDIAADIFRAKNAGRYNDRQARDADEAAFRDFLKIEEEAERKLDSLDSDINDDKSTITSLSEDIDIDAYADDIMSEMKPRPQARRPKREEFMSQEELQRERKKESIFGDDDTFFPSSSSSPTSRQLEGGGSTSFSGGGMPEWFRKEQEALGIKVEDFDADVFDEEEARRAWEREARQQKADEYLKRRGEGISISDVLGREYFGPMDEPEDDYERSRPTFDSFKARKELLLGYTELTVEDINNVVDYKTDPLSTGYSRYLSKIQRPFSEYGAIFRLEGVLVDMIGMHARAWKKVAETFGYNLQSKDDIKQASLYKPEDAVRWVFYWTDDIFDLKDISKAHHAAFQEAFDEWIDSGGNVVAGSSDEQVSVTGDSSSGPTKIMPGEEEMNSMYFIAWSKLAKTLDKSAPTWNEVYRGVLGGDWEVAVRDIFCWCNDPSEVYEIVVAYDKILQEDYKILLNKYGVDLDKMNAKAEETLFCLDFPDLSLQEGVREWLNTLREVEMPCAIVSHLNSSQLDTVLRKTGLAEYFPLDLRVSSDSNYPSERSELLGAALRIEQRPDQCIVFDNTPNSAKEAHEIFMKSVSFVNHYARYELLTADLSVGYMRDLDLRSLLKLFDKREDLEPLLELDVRGGLQKQQRKVKTAFWDE